MNNIQTKIQTKKGFTLVEIMVALMIFSLVVVVALAALVKIVDANRKAQSIQDAVINMSFTIESMTREMRTGSNFYCTPLSLNDDLAVTALGAGLLCPSQNFVSNRYQNFAIAFESNRLGASCRLINAYQFEPVYDGTTFSGTFTVKKASQNYCDGPLLFAPLFSSKAVTVTNYHVRIGPPGPPTTYTLLFIKLDGIAGSNISGQTNFSLQTAASPRTK